MPWRVEYAEQSRENREEKIIAGREGIFRYLPGQRRPGCRRGMVHESRWDQMYHQCLSLESTYERREYVKQVHE